MINHTKRFIGQTNIEDEIAALEADAAIACKTFDEEVAKRDEYRKQIKGEERSCWLYSVICHFSDANSLAEMEEEQKSLMDSIAESQGDLSAYQQDLAKVSAQRSELENQLSEAQDKLAKAEKSRADLLDKKRRFEGDLGSFRRLAACKRDVCSHLNFKILIFIVETWMRWRFKSSAPSKRRPTAITGSGVSMTKSPTKMS